MKRYLGPMGLLLSAVLLLASCLKNDDEDVTLYDDTAITSFQITTARYTSILSRLSVQTLSMWRPARR